MNSASHSMAEGCRSAVTPCYHQRYDPTTICELCRNDSVRLAEQTGSMPAATTLLQSPEGSPISPSPEALLVALDQLQITLLQRDVEPRLDDKWGLMDTRTADQGANYPGELISEHTNYDEARLAMMRKAIALARTTTTTIPATTDPLPSAQAPAPPLELRVGGYYRRGDGTRVGPVYRRDEVWYARGTPGDWLISGEALHGLSPSHPEAYLWDLVAEWEGPAEMSLTQRLRATAAGWAIYSDERGLASGLMQEAAEALENHSSGTSA